MFDALKEFHEIKDEIDDAKITLTPALTQSVAKIDGLLSNGKFAKMLADFNEPESSDNLTIMFTNAIYASLIRKTSDDLKKYKSFDDSKDKASLLTIVDGAVKQVDAGLQEGGDDSEYNIKKNTNKSKKNKKSNKRKTKKRISSTSKKVKFSRI
jgi:hypothetical protein